MYFNPLPPHGGRRVYKPLPDLARHFNPLPPHGGRPADARYRYSFTENFNPLPPHGGRLNKRPEIVTNFCISIHSLRMEGDTTSGGISGSFAISIHSLRMEGDWACSIPDSRTAYISIHSLRMEGDGLLDFSKWLTVHFNPLPPHGGRPPPLFSELYEQSKFQSTPSAWRETL